VVGVRNTGILFGLFEDLANRHSASSTTRGAFSFVNARRFPERLARNVRCGDCSPIWTICIDRHSRYVMLVKVAKPSSEVAGSGGKERNEKPGGHCSTIAVQSKRSIAGIGER
jgi:hypothetical protein